MLILELAVQSVRGFSASARINLRAGYLGLKAPGEVPAPLAGLFLALAYPDGRGSDGSFLAPGAKTGRAGFSVQTDDQQIWRLVRDLGGQGALHLLNRDSNQFEVVTQDATEMAQMLRAQVGLPGRSTFQHLYTFSMGQLPSKQPKVRPGQEKQKGGRSSARDLSSGVDVEEAKARIAVLEKELVGAKEVAEYQFRLDGAQSELFNAEQRLKVFQELKQRTALARAEYEQAPTPKILGLPDDIVERVTRAKLDKQRHNEALQRLANEREQAGLQQEALKVPPLHGDRRFLGAVGLGLILLVGGMAGEGLWRYLAVLAIPFFSGAALLALRFIEDLQHASREGAKGDVFDQRERKLKEEYQQSVALVESALDKVGATTNDEFFAVMARREELLPAMEQIQAELSAAESDPVTQGLEMEVEHLKAELEELNERMAAMGGSSAYVREAREIDRELQHLREQIAPPAPPKASDSSMFSGVADPSETFEDPIPKLLDLSQELFATDAATLWSVLRDRVLQYYTALADRRYHDVDVDASGRATVHAPGRTIPAGELPAKDLDLLYLATRLTIIEKWSTQQKLPVLMEDAFGAVIDGPKQALFARMLKHVGTLTQVVQVSGASQPTYAETVLAC